MIQMLAWYVYGDFDILCMDTCCLFGGEIALHLDKALHCLTELCFCVLFFVNFWDPVVVY